MYESPIHLYISEISQQIAKQQDEQIWQAVVRCVPDVDKQELIRALQYDRKQYEKGYADGNAAAMAELVQCKDCQMWKCHGMPFDITTGTCHNPIFHFHHGHVIDECFMPVTNETDFCSYGERREGE